MLIEKRLGEAYDRYDNNGKKESPEEQLTKARSEDIFARPEKSEMNGPPTIFDQLILGTIVLAGICSLVYFFFF